MRYLKVECLTRRAGVDPLADEPEADQFAKHLRYFRRSDKISVGTQNVFAHIITGGRMRQDLRHVGRHRQGTAELGKSV